MPALASLALRLGADSISKFESAATRRFTEASLLLQSKEYLAAVYLFGYVAETRMKAARYRLLGYYIHDEITAGVRQMALEDAVGIAPSRYQHDLEYEATLLVYARKKHRAGYSRPFQADLIFQATALNARWRPALRYRTTAVLPAEAADVRLAAEWFELNYPRLWS